MAADWIDDWLGATRFAPYLQAAGSDRTKALALYEWNFTLAHSLMRDIAHFEIALRNAYDRAISSRWTASDHWLIAPESPVVMPIWRVKADRHGFKRGTDVNYRNRRSVDNAIQKCGRHHATPGKVMAELSFGFWSHLTTASHEKALWVPYLHHAYQPGTSRKHIDRIISTINTVRNRIAHHEPIFDRTQFPEQQPHTLHADLLDVLTRLSPTVSTHIQQTSTVATTLAQRP